MNVEESPRERKVHRIISDSISESDAGVDSLGRIRITGGIPLDGEVRIQGSKNAALPIMAAALLNRGTTVLKGCPRIADVFLMEQMLRDLGARTCWQGGTLEICARELKSCVADKELGKKMRSSIVLLGSLLGRLGEGVLPFPGGCVIGARPIDLHLEALRKLGAEFMEEEGCLYGRARGLRGGEITFPRSSVGATQNAVLGAVCAQGTTVIRGCSREPEVSWLCRFLNQAGGRICGIGTSCLEIRGVSRLHDTVFQIPSDRIAAGTYVCASAITRGKGILLDPPVGEMGALLKAYEKIGGQYMYKSGKLFLCSQRAFDPLRRLETGVYPGFPTDLQSIFLAVLTCARGESLIRENIFEDRFKVVLQLQKMGAQITLDGRSARIRGGRIFGTSVKAEELRGGAALVIAGLGAEGETCVESREFIERGYEDISRDLNDLGARTLKD